MAESFCEISPRKEVSTAIATEGPCLAVGTMIEPGTTKGEATKRKVGSVALGLISVGPLRFTQPPKLAPIVKRMARRAISSMGNQKSLLAIVIEERRGVGVLALEVSFRGAVAFPHGLAGELVQFYDFAVRSELPRTIAP